MSKSAHVEIGGVVFVRNPAGGLCAMLDSREGAMLVVNDAGWLIETDAWAPNEREAALNALGWLRGRGIEPETRKEGEPT